MNFRLTVAFNWRRCITFSFLFSLFDFNIFALEPLLYLAIGCSVSTCMNKGLSDKTTTTTNYQHHYNHYSTCRTTMTNTNETKHQLPDHTKCCVRFSDVWGSKICNVFSPLPQHINRRPPPTHTHTLVWTSVGAERCSSEGQAVCALSTQLTLSFRKVRHIFIYVLLFNKPVVQ